MALPRPYRGQEVLAYLQDLVAALERGDHVTVDETMRKRPTGTGFALGATPAAGGALPFSGVVWVLGKKYTPTQSSPSQTWIKVDVANGTVTYDATGPANESQFEDGVEWYRVAQLSGDLHVTGF